MVPSILIDNNNFDDLLPALLEEISQSKYVGFDIETEDSQRHDGLNAYMKTNEEGKKASNRPLVFDVNRTVVTGFSWYCLNGEQAYYLNLAHADVENRVPWKKARQILRAKSPSAFWVIHNATFERTFMKKGLTPEGRPLNFDLDKVICTLQLAVSAFNDDTYHIKDFQDYDFRKNRDLMALLTQVDKQFDGYKPGGTLTPAQEDLLMKFVSKSSDAKHSYNGIVKELAFGYGLKGLSQKFLGYKQKTFQETLGENVHMGQLTGKQVVSYGADDAVVCLMLLKPLMDYLKKSPNVRESFLKVENRISEVFSAVWRDGVKVSRDSILFHLEDERVKSAEVLRRMKKAVRGLLPFPEEPHEKLLKYDKWYTKNWQKYRHQVEEWANSEDFEDAYLQHQQVRSPISIAWAEEKGRKPSKGINLVHYMPQRTVLYDLCRCSFIMEEGKTASNGEARNKMLEREKTKRNDENVIEVLNCYRDLGDAEQVMKLFLTGYLQLTDPETERMYPVLSSMLNTRRMACSNPNLQQCPKGGRLEFVRSFFLPDGDDYLIVSADWSSIELVIIGALSNDPEYLAAFGQKPYNDLHSTAAKAVLGMSDDEYNNHPDKKVLRRDFGKGANFSYTFSGALSSIGKTMGWSSEEMWKRTESFRQKFSVFEEWRVGTIENSRKHGFVELFDGHRRWRYEGTSGWTDQMRRKFHMFSPNVRNFGELAIKKIRSRSGNQSVNALIQGGCAHLAKNTILVMINEIKRLGWDVRFMFAVHDELVFSVHKSLVEEFIPFFRFHMENYGHLFPNVALDCTVSIGKNYGPYNENYNQYGQIELDEIQKPVAKQLGIEGGSKVDPSDYWKVINYLMGEVQ